MPENRPTPLTCPTCGAALDYDGKSTVIRCKYCRNACVVPGAAQAASGPALDEIRRLAMNDNTLEAIRRYREAYRVDLKEARQAVEALQAGRLAEPSELARPLPPVESGEVVDEIRKLLNAGKKADAIRRYREIYDVSMARARYAVEQVEAGRAIWPVAGFPAVPAEAKPSGAKSRAACLFALALALFIGGVFAFVLCLPGGPFVPLLIANGPATLLPAEAGAPSDTVAVFYDPNDEHYLLGRLAGDSGRFAWRSEPLPGSDYARGIAYDARLVFVASGAGLLAYSQADGSLAWQALMPDELNYSDDNLLVVAGRVITSNVDQSIQAYDAASGALVWNMRLAGYDRSLRLVGGQLVVIDPLGEDYVYSLIFLDPLDGRELRSLTPTCQEAAGYSPATIDPDSGFLVDETEDSLYLVYDSSPGCVQRIDLATGQMAWQTTSEEWFTFSPYGFSGLLGQELLYFNQGNELISVERGTGRLRILVADEDYEFVPLALSGNTLIVRARRTRGSERFELWGVDPGSGEPRWQLDLTDAGPLDPPDEMAGLVDGDESAWTWRLADAGLLLVRFEADPHQVVIVTLDPTNGAQLNETTVALRGIVGDFYSIPEILGWQEGLLYAGVDGNIYAIDVNAGEILFVR